jgi:hypothetical protein
MDGSGNARLFAGESTTDNVTIPFLDRFWREGSDIVPTSDFRPVLIEDSL